MKDWFEEQKQAGLEDTPEQVIVFEKCKPCEGDSFAFFL